MVRSLLTLLSISFFIVLFTKCSIAYEKINIYDPSVIYIGNGINENTETMVNLKRNKIKYVILNSDGGIINNADRIATILKDIGDVTTIIPYNGKCESSCTIIFQAGKNRYISSRSTMLYHAARHGGEHWEYLTSRCSLDARTGSYCRNKINQAIRFIFGQTIRMFTLLETSGLSHEVYERVKNQPRQEDGWYERGNLTQYGKLRIGPDDAIRYNAATKIIDYILIVASPN